MSQGDGFSTKYVLPLTLAPLPAFAHCPRPLTGTKFANGGLADALAEDLPFEEEDFLLPLALVDGRESPGVLLLPFAAALLAFVLAPLGGAPLMGIPLPVASFAVLAPAWPALLLLAVGAALPLVPPLANAAPLG
eukprot:scaffold4501_cov395-Prasinococcus_capsulatus_cf.AAC.20